MSASFCEKKVLNNQTFHQNVYLTGIIFYRLTEELIKKCLL